MKIAEWLVILSALASTAGSVFMFFAVRHFKRRAEQFEKMAEEKAREVRSQDNWVASVARAHSRAGFTLAVDADGDLVLRKFR